MRGRRRERWPIGLALLAVASFACRAFVLEATPAGANLPAPAEVSAAPTAHAEADTPAAIVSTDTAVAVGTPFPGPWAGDGVVEVTGSDEFVRQTQAALDLLAARAPDAYQKILTYVGVIGEGQHSGMWAYETPPRYEVGDPTAFSTLTWYASTIAHDATHSQLYYEYLRAHPGQAVPQEAWADVASERFCNSYQLDVLTRIGAPASEIEYLAGLSGDHCDVDHDGDCDWDDYDSRDW